MTFSNVQPTPAGFADARAWLCVNDNGTIAVYPTSILQHLPNWPGNWRWTLVTPELAKAIEGLGQQVPLRDDVIADKDRSIRYLATIIGDAVNRLNDAMLLSPKYPAPAGTSAEG